MGSQRVFNEVLLILEHGCHHMVEIPYNFQGYVYPLSEFESFLMCGCNNSACKVLLYWYLNQFSGYQLRSWGPIALHI